MHQQLAVHRAIMVVDVERFGDPGRTNLNQLAVRDGLYKALIQAFEGSGIAWGSCVSEDRGDGALILVPPEVPKAYLVTSLPGMLAATVSRHNAACAGPEQMRLRVALHAGEWEQDGDGVDDPLDLLGGGHGRIWAAGGGQGQRGGCGQVHGGTFCRGSRDRSPSGWRPAGTF